MSASDPFGLQREERIKKSKVREVFTPHRPINSVNLFWGRQKEVQKLLEHINTPGQHALLYGDRGVGKSSLANIAAELLISKLIKGKLYKKRCDSKDTFETIVSQPLKAVGVDVNITTIKSAHEQGAKAGLKVPIAEAGIDSKRINARESKASPLSPSAVADHLLKAEGLLLIDETDALTNPDDKKRLAELIKLLSDNGSGFKLLVVGIAETAEQLTGGHASVQRCLKETKLGRMRGDELSLIITEGGRELGLRFEVPVVQKIVRLSAGYPHFTQLLALKCAEEATANGNDTIVAADLDSALAAAVEDAEGTLRRVYNSAVRSYNTDMYRVILQAAAQLGRDEFSAGQLRTGIEKVTGDGITQQGLNNYLNRLISDDGSTVLVRKSKGIYKFSDPRMPSFIKIANVTTQD